MEQTTFYKLNSKLSLPKKLKDNIYIDKKTKTNYIEPLSKVNLFTGANNSGKSLVIREIIKEIDKLEYPHKSIIDLINLSLDEAQVSINNILKKHYADSFQLNNNLYLSRDGLINEIKHYNGTELVSIYISNLTKYFSNHNVDIRYLINQGSSRSGINNTEQENYRNTLKKIEEILVDKIIKLTSTIDYSIVYIPTIRSLRKYNNNINFLKEKTKSEYNFSDKISIENGQNLYEDIKSRILNFDRETKRVEDYENFLSENFFQGKRVKIKPIEQLNELSIRIGKEKEKPIYELGDGLQMIVILTFPLFLYDRGILAIEEPEIFVHPGLQKKLMDIFINHERSKNFQFFIATHSNHIIDSSNLSDKTSLFGVSKYLKDENLNDEIEPNFIIRNLNHEGNSALSLLGVSNSSVYLSNCTIWIEGISDMLYINTYIKEYLKNDGINSKYKICKKFQEGIHYSYVFSGGDNIIHYDFSDNVSIEELSKKIVVKNLCGRAMVIVDDDNKKNKRRKEEFFETLGGRFLTLEVIEIENLLSNETIVNTIKTFPSWSNETFNSSNFLTPNKVAKMRLGTYIDTHLTKGINKAGKKKFSVSNPTKAESVTINCKTEFANKAVPHISYSNMTEYSKKLVENILDFIISNNI